MRDIRARIAQRSGVELSNPQIQELAARRLEAILDPRGLKPELLDQLRRAAGERPVAVDVVAPAAGQPYPFDESTLYDSPNALLRFIRKLLRPLLRMMFNPTPIAHALALQSRLNTEIAAREAERDRRQAEWNALHYEILQRLALDVSRASVDAQSLSLRVESLAAKVDFNERRVRAMEGVQMRTARPPESVQPAQVASSVVTETGVSAPPPSGESQPAEAPRRRRRRRRGRRGPSMAVPTDVAASAPLPQGIETEDAEAETEDVFDEDGGAESASVPGLTSDRQPMIAAEPAPHREESEPAAPASEPTRNEEAPPKNDEE